MRAALPPKIFALISSVSCGYPQPSISSSGMRLRCGLKVFNAASSLWYGQAE